MIRRAASAALLLAAAPAAAEPVNCADPGCEGKISASCLQRVGAGSLPAGDACAAQQSAYVACLRRVAETCSSPRPAPQATADWRDAFTGDWVRVEPERPGACSKFYRFAREGGGVRWAQRKEGALDWRDRGLADVSEARTLAFMGGQVKLRIADGALYLFNRPDRWICKFERKR